MLRQAKKLMKSVKSKASKSKGKSKVSRRKRVYFFGGGKAEGKADGHVEAAVAALFAVLEARSLEVSETARARILSCHDRGKLEQWLRRAATAPTVEHVFE